MKFKITLRDKRNDYQKAFIEEYDDWELADWIWREGNYSCDCNRSLFLYEWDESKALECNTDENVIELVELEWVIE